MTATIIIAVLLSVLAIEIFFRTGKQTQADGSLKTYPVRYTCSNCEHKFDSTLPRGVSVMSMNAREICPSCGCETTMVVAIKPN